MSDNFQLSEQANGQFRPVSEILLALRFLTRLPIPFASTVDPVPLASAMRMFGVAGAGIGALNGLFLWGISYLHLPGMIGAVLSVGFGLFLTGALHEDGLADSADGLFGGKTRERRLEIMRDSRIGTYGACALVLALLIRVEAYQALAAYPQGQMIAILAATAAFSRAMVVDMMWATRPARPDGLSAYAGRPSRNAGLFAIVSGGALAVFAGWPTAPIVGVQAMLVALLITGLIRRLATRLVGGQTGDVCGAVQVLVEIGMLMTFLASIH